MISKFLCELILRILFIIIQEWIVVTWCKLSIMIRQMQSNNVILLPQEGLNWRWRQTLQKIRRLFDFYVSRAFKVSIDILPRLLYFRLPPRNWVAMNVKESFCRCLWGKLCQLIQFNDCLQGIKGYTLRDNITVENLREFPVSHVNSSCRWTDVIKGFTVKDCENDVDIFILLVHFDFFSKRGKSLGNCHEGHKSCHWRSSRR